MTDRDMILAVAARQHGVVRFEQAMRAGHTRHSIRHQVTAGRWSRLHPRVYAVTTGPPAATTRAAAALLAFGADLDAAATGHIALSHGTAAVAWGVTTPDYLTEVVHVLVPHVRHLARRPGVHAHRSRAFGPRDVVVRDRLPLTDLERSVVDCCTIARSLDDVRALLAQPVQQSRTTVARLAAAADRLGAAPRTAWLREALAGVMGGDRSAAETRLRELVAAAHVRPPVQLATVLTRRGRVVPDMYWEDLALAVEVDGEEWHLSPADWRDDLDRQNALVAAGITVLRFTPFDLRARPDDVVAEIAAAVACRIQNLRNTG